MIEPAIYNLLKDNTAVAAIVSTRIYPDYVPQNALIPAITYQQLSGTRDHTLTDSVDMVPSSWQLNCWEENMPDARSLANAVRVALDNYSGTKSSTVIQCIHLDDEGDILERKPGSDVITRFGKRLDFRIWFNE